MEQRSAEAVANYFIGRANAAAAGGRPHDVTPMKVQKLLYFAHGWHLALTDGEALFPEPIEAWEFGPVIRSVYETFRDYGGEPILEPGRELDIVDGELVEVERAVEDPSGWTQELLDTVWDRYGHLTAGQLSRMTHEPGTPWDTVYRHFRGEPRRGTDIPDELIRQAFEELRADAGPPVAATA